MRTILHYKFKFKFNLWMFNLLFMFISSYYKPRHLQHIFLWQDHMLLHAHCSHTVCILLHLDWTIHEHSHTHTPHRTALCSQVDSHSVQPSAPQTPSLQLLLSVPQRLLGCLGKQNKQQSPEIIVSVSGT